MRQRPEAAERIALIVEGETEKAFRGSLNEFLAARLPNRMPRLRFVPQDGRIPMGDKLRRLVDNLLGTQFDHVIAVTDVYPGTRPPDFLDAADARNKMRQWVGAEPRFHPHAAQYDFEAWLLPYWETIKKLAGTERSAPHGNPETINHDRPPSYHIRDLFEAGRSRDSYVKPRDAKRILRGQDLAVAAEQCSELRDFLNTILTICRADPIPHGKGCP